MPYLDLSDARIWYTDTGGDGVPVVLMHPASGSTDSWVYQRPAFTAAGYRCLAFDRRGWGRTETASTPEQAGYASDDLDALLEGLGIADRFHLVGTAAGAAPSLDYALSHPHRLRSLVVGDATFGVQDPEYLATLDRIRPPQFTALPASLRELSASYRAADPEGTERWIAIEHSARRKGVVAQSTRNRVTFAMLETLQVPTLVVVGDADLSTPPSMHRQVASHIPGCQQVVIPEAGHAAFWEQPDAWNAAVLTFLNTTRT